MPDNRSFIGIEDGRLLAQAIFDTVREPLLVLDKDLRVVVASRSFYRMFQVGRDDTQGRLFTHWATVNGTFLRCVCGWKISCPSTA